MQISLLFVYQLTLCVPVSFNCKQKLGAKLLKKLVYFVRLVVKAAGRNQEIVSSIPILGIKAKWWLWPNYSLSAQFSSQGCCSRGNRRKEDVCRPELFIKIITAGYINKLINTLMQLVMNEISNESNSAINIKERVF